MLKLPRALADAIRRHAERDYPEECCGVLLGRMENENGVRNGDRDGARTVAEVLPCANAVARPASHNRYAIAPHELIAAQRAARERGLVIAGFYHSHPDHDAAPSATDTAQAYWPECVYVIVSVAQGKASEMNAFLLAGNGEARLQPEAIAISDRPDW
ncbi:MAG: M67 family metallopeptidase [Acidobacteriota bacterium]|nr:M67 family metallopeptidase [Acidobacteriota bacterium]